MLVGHQPVFYRRAALHPAGGSHGGQLPCAGAGDGIVGAAADQVLAEAHAGGLAAAGEFAGLGDQHAGIPLTPTRTLLAQVAGKGLLAPGAVHRIDDRREGRHRSVAPGVAQCAHQRAVAAHGVAEDARAPRRGARARPETGVVGCA